MTVRPESAEGARQRKKKKKEKTKKPSEKTEEGREESAPVSTMKGEKKKGRKKKKKATTGGDSGGDRNRPFASPLTESKRREEEEGGKMGGDEGGGGQKRRGRKKKRGKKGNDDDRRQRSNDDEGYDERKRREEDEEVEAEEEEERRRNKRLRAERVEREEEEETALTADIFGGTGFGGGDEGDRVGGATDDFLFGGGGGEKGKEMEKKKKRTSRRAGADEEESADDDDGEDVGDGIPTGDGFVIDRAGEDSSDPSASGDDGEGDDGDYGRGARGRGGPDDRDTRGVGSEDDAVNAGGAAWSDSDDERHTTSILTKSNLRKLRKTREEGGVVTSGELERRLRERYAGTAGRGARVDWADVGDAAAESSGDDEDEGTSTRGGPTAASLLSSTAPLLSSGGRDDGAPLPPTSLSIVRLPDLNLSSPCASTVSSVRFHPSSPDASPLSFTAGMDKTLRFFRFRPDGGDGGRREEGGDDGCRSEKVHGVHFPNFPVRSAEWMGDSDRCTGKVLLTSRRKFFYSYDAGAGRVERFSSLPGRGGERSLETMTCGPDGRTAAFVGDDGYVLLWDNRSKGLTGELKINGTLRCLAFDKRGDRVAASGGDGDVYSWDLRRIGGAGGAGATCVGRFKNEDGTVTSALAFGGAGAESDYLAVAAESGVVNLYEDGDGGTTGDAPLPTPGRARPPLSSHLNVRTSISALSFHPSSDILAFGSRRDKDTLRMLHVPSRTVFADWPTAKTPLGYVWSLDWSPGGQYMAIGNDKGQCLLYRLGHY
mmetsp:Transcript_44361/g.135196  ORF Transcript_44361/g.135196 Transcript_44361/m.135196 type:complete len:770 (-) Transcript_44361:271-2580(-)